jgi:predicted metal-binding protein
MIEIKFNPKILKNYFDLKVREQCKSCKRYSFSAQCPPHLESVEYYKSILPLYNYGLIFYETFNTDLSNWEHLGKVSSLKIYNRLIDKRKELLEEGHVYIIGFGAGSCKLCNECAYHCKKPSESFAPIEGCGIDVIKLMKHFDIDIVFPVNNKFKFARVGMILYD